MNTLHVLIPKLKSEADYQVFLQLADDKEKLNETLNAYEDKLMTFISTMKSNGTEINREYINVAEMIKWLSDNKYDNIGKHRALHYSHLMKRIHEYKDIGN
jgi:hypothetical protein